MFSWFKRLLAARAKPPTAARRSAPPADKKASPSGGRSGSSRPAQPAFQQSGPAALPEVLGEGNTQADWNAWEDSMTALDSQMQEELVPSSRVHVRDTRPSQLDDIDPFSSVRRKRDI